jgi:ADP-ribose pyrophosphatase
LLERQHRYPLHRDFIEFPAGKIDPGEEDLSCGQRELREETGYQAQLWTHVATLYPCIGYANERMEFFHAQQLEYVGHARDSDEFLEVLRVPFDEAIGWLRSGKICETKTVVGLFWLEKLLAK